MEVKRVAILLLAAACARVPESVVCLLSALRVHEIGTRVPAEVWIAIPQGARSALLMRHGTMTLRYYHPHGTDPQTPHDQDEIYIVAAGRGTVVSGPSEAKLDRNRGRFAAGRSAGICGLSMLANVQPGIFRFGRYAQAHYGI